MIAIRGTRTSRDLADLAGIQLPLNLPSEGSIIGKTAPASGWLPISNGRNPGLDEAEYERDRVFDLCRNRLSYLQKHTVLAPLLIDDSVHVSIARNYRACHSGKRLYIGKDSISRTITELQIKFPSLFPNPTR